MFILDRCTWGQCRLILGFAALCLLTPTATWAKAKTVQDVGLGLAAGATTGFGLSARLRLAGGFGISLAGMPYFDPDRRAGSVGLQGTWDFLSHKGLSVYALLGTHLFISRFYYKNAFRQDRVRRRYDSLVVGPGVGIELRNGRFALNLDAAIAGVFALHPRTYLRYPGRVNLGVFPNLSACIYLGPQRH